MEDLLCFVAVEFEDDPNVKGYFYWYLCTFSGAEEGDKVIAPLGRHNNTQKGTVRKVRYLKEEEAPFPMHSIKLVKSLIKENGNVQNS